MAASAEFNKYCTKLPERYLAPKYKDGKAKSEFIYYRNSDQAAVDNLFVFDVQPPVDLMPQPQPNAQGATGGEN